MNFEIQMRRMTGSPSGLVKQKSPKGVPTP